MKTTLVIPCFNEGKRLDQQAFLSFVKDHQDLELLFVNDGSTDNTAAIINGMSETSSQIKAIHLTMNSGKAEAVRQGFLSAFKGGPEIVGFFDADLAAPLRSIDEMLPSFNTPAVAMVIGSRVCLLGRKIERNELRHLAGRIFATATSNILGLRVYDTQCGAKLFRNTERLRSVFAASFSTRWIFDVEILARFILTEKDGLPKVKDICVEHPLQEWVDKKGSKVGLKAFIISGLDLLKVIFLLRRKNLPGL